MIVFWPLCAILALATWLVGRNDRRRVVAAARWPVVDGRVVKAEVESSGWQYLPRVSYAYVVAGQGYASDRTRPGGTPYFYSQAQAEAALAPYQPGGPIAVHYDPERPDRAVIEAKPLSYAFRLLVLITIAEGVLALVVTLMELG